MEGVGPPWRGLVHHEGVGPPWRGLVHHEAVSKCCVAGLGAGEWRVDQRCDGRPVNTTMYYVDNWNSSDVFTARLVPPNGNTTIFMEQRLTEGRNRIALRVENEILSGMITPNNTIVLYTNMSECNVSIVYLSKIKGEYIKR